MHNKQEIINAYYQWVDSLCQPNESASKIAELFHPKAVVIPELSTKIRTSTSQIINYYEKLYQDFPSINLTTVELITRHHGEFATNDGLFTLYLENQDTNVSINTRFTFVYVKYENKWKIISGHSSQFPRAPRPNNNYNK